MKPTPWERSATATLVLGAATTAIFIYFAFRAQFPVPYIDDWATLALLAREAPFAALWQAHNEHVIVLLRLLIWIDYWVWGWPGYATIVAGLLAHAAMAASLGLACQARPREEVRLLVGAALVLIFSTYGLQGIVFRSAMGLPLVTGFATLACACIDRSARRSGSTVGWHLLALGSSVLAMLSLTSGLIVPFILAGLAATLRVPARLTSLYVALGLIGVITRVLLGGIPDHALSASAAATVRFGLTMLAGPVGAVSPGLALAVGAVFALLAVGAGVRFLVTRGRGTANAWVAGTLAFTIASAAMASVGRAQFDPSAAAESRYASIAAVGWAALLCALLPAGAAASRLGRATAVAIPIAALLALPVQVFMGHVWTAKADHLAAAGTVLAAGVSDEDWTWRLHVLGSPGIEAALPPLRERGVAFLQFPESGQRIEPVAGVSRCGADVSAFDAGLAGPDLRIRGRLPERGAYLRLLDAESRVQGLARPAPSVSDPRATANEFVWAELDILMGRVPRDGYWLGVSHRGAGPPYRVELVDEDGGVVCDAPVVCCDAPADRGSRGEIVVRGSMVEGYLDQATCEQIGGWAWDPIRPDATVDVRIAVTGGRAVVVRAATFRQDLLDSRKGTGAHAFVARGADLGLGPGRWEIRASVAATGVALPGSPTTITCEP